MPTNHIVERLKEQLALLERELHVDLPERIRIARELGDIRENGEFEVAKDLVVGAKYVNRDLPQIIEDALSADGDYFIGNPSKGLMTGTYDIGYAVRGGRAAESAGRRLSGTLC